KEPVRYSRLISPLIAPTPTNATRHRPNADASSVESRPLINPAILSRSAAARFELRCPQIPGRRDAALSLPESWRELSEEADKSEEYFEPCLNKLPKCAVGSGVRQANPAA
ncbi:hypothetical protein, partial [Methylobacterium nigriterrae]|uniref:hypothetical protein n=1 Tax=Methylobacterium nigriterrae TaxID=3127512 RepID=UPI003013DB3D